MLDNASLLLGEGSGPLLALGRLALVELGRSFIVCVDVKWEWLRLFGEME